MKQHTNMPDPSDKFIKDKNFSDELDVLKDAMAEAEDLCAEVAVEMYREAKQAAREVERLSKEVGE
jgi:hypothetical protein